MVHRERQTFDVFAALSVGRAGVHANVLSGIGGTAHVAKGGTRGEGARERAPAMLTGFRMVEARSLNGRCERVWEEGHESRDLRERVKGFQRLGARKVLRLSDDKQSPKPKKPEGMRI